MIKLNNMLLPNNTLMQSLKKIDQINAQDRSQKPIFHIHFVNKGQLPLCLFDKICPSMIPNHSSPISTHIHCTKFEEKKDVNCSIMVHWNQFSNTNQGNNSEFTWQNLPIYNPNHFSPISTLKTSLKKIRQKKCSR